MHQPERPACRTVCLFTSKIYRWHQIILLGGRGTCVCRSWSGPYSTVNMTKEFRLQFFYFCKFTLISMSKHYLIRHPFYILCRSCIFSRCVMLRNNIERMMPIAFRLVHYAVTSTIQGGPKSKPLARISLNMIKTANDDRLFFIKFECKRITKMSSVGSKHSTCDRIRDVINYCVLSSDVRSVCGEFAVENPKTR